MGLGEMSLCEIGRIGRYQWQVARISEFDQCLFGGNFRGVAAPRQLDTQHDG